MGEAKQARHCTCCKVLRWVVGVVLLGIGVVLIAWATGFVNDQLRAGIKQYINIDSPSSQGWDAFKYSTTKDQPQYYDLYAYSVVNLDEVIATGSKPVFEEVGPVTYQLFEFKIDMKVSPDQSNVSYKLWRHLVPLDPKAANRTVTVPNFMLWGAAGAAQANTTFLKDVVWAAVDAILGFPDTAHIAFQQRTVGELFFGYPDPILEAADRLPLKTKLPSTFPGLIGNLSSPAETRNNTGTSVQLTGKGDLSMARQFVQWNGMRHLRCCETGPCGSPSTKGEQGTPTWLTREANDLTHGAGSYGTQFAPFLPPHGSTQQLFVDVLFRSANVTSLGADMVQVKRIPCQRFVIPASELGNSSVNPFNAAYRMSGIPSGLIDISECEAHVPILISKAHFLDADPALRAQFQLVDEDQTPLNRTKYDTFIDVEPQTGTTMRVHERLQINMRMGPFGSFMPHVPHMVWPVGWLDKRALVTDDLAGQWHSSVGFATLLETAVMVGGWALIGIGTLLMILFAYWDCCSRPSKQTSEEAASARLRASLLVSRDDDALSLDGGLQ